MGDGRIRPHLTPFLIIQWNFTIGITKGKRLSISRKCPYNSDYESESDIAKRRLNKTLKLPLQLENIGTGNMTLALIPSTNSHSRIGAFHQSDPGSIPGLCVVFGLALSVMYSALRGFSRGSLVFPSLKPTFDLIWIWLNLLFSLNNYYGTCAWLFEKAKGIAEMNSLSSYLIHIIQRESPASSWQRK